VPCPVGDAQQSEIMSPRLDAHSKLEAVAAAARHDLLVA